MATAHQSLRLICILLVPVAASLHHKTSHIAAATQANPSHQSNQVYFQDGDVILGGLFPLHNYRPATRDCVGIRDSRALMLVEAMVYAVERINNDTELLPNVRLGFEIYDSCYSEMWTLKQALNFIPPDQKRSCLVQDKGFIPESGVQSMNCLHMKRVAGVVGAQRSASSAELAILLGLYKIPQVSYLSTLDTLNKDAYPYFLRVVPSDSHQVNAIIDLALYFGWTYISLLVSDNEYGENGYYEFTKQTEQRGVCLAYTAQISVDIPHPDDYYDNLIADLRRYPYNRASVVVLFAHLAETRMFLEAVKRNNAVGEFTFIASDGIGSFGKQGLSGLEDAALGMITMVPYSEGNFDFLKYFLKTLASDSPNPWIKEYTDRYTWCEFILSGFFCPKNRTDILSPHETLVIDSVYVFAYALDSMLRAECNNKDDFTDCELVKNIDGAKLFSYMKNSSFESLSNGRVFFDVNRDGNIRYKIRNLNDALGWMTFVDVGTWEESKTLLDINEYVIRFYTNDTGGVYGKAPTSVCSAPCQLGSRKSFVDDSKCCWLCVECEANSTVVNNTECHHCTPPQWPNTNRTDCVSLQENYMSWDRIEGTVIKVFAFIGLLEAFFIMTLYFTRFRRRIVRRSDPILCVLIQAGACLALVGAFFTTLRPSTGICVVARIAPSIAYSLIFVPFAVKCARLYRVFIKARDTDSEEEADLLSLKKQFFIMSIAWTVEIGISVAWIVVFPPAVDYTFTPVDDAVGGENSVNLEVACNFQLREMVTEIGISMPFLLGSITLSLLARALPDNYHEARFCVFASACTMLVIVGSYAAFFGTNPAGTTTTLATMYRALGMIAVSVVMMTCLFLPKMYVIYLVRGDIDEVLLKKRQSMASMAVYRSRASTVSTVPMMNGASSQGKRRSRAKSLKSVSEAPSTSGDKDTAIELKAISTSVI